MLKIIEKSKKHELYMRAFSRALSRYADSSTLDIKASIKKLIFYGVRAFNSKVEQEIITREQAEYDFQFTELIKAFIGSLTPAEFMNIFPIKKDFDGHRWGMKDYFSTMEYIKTLDQDKPIESEIDDFLWEFMNTETHIFLAKSYGIISDLRRLDGHRSLMEEFCEENGIKTYTKHEDAQGREFLFDKATGRTARLHKPRPKHLKLIKAGRG